MGTALPGDNLNALFDISLNFLFDFIALCIFISVIHLAIILYITYVAKQIDHNSQTTLTKVQNIDKYSFTGNQYAF